MKKNKIKKTNPKMIKLSRMPSSSQHKRMYQAAYDRLVELLCRTLLD
jgi:hypothetical protein